MAVVEVKIQHKDGRMETRLADGNGPPTPTIQRGAGMPGMPGAAPPVYASHGAGSLVVYIDPDIFETDAEPLARWLTAAGLALFAVGPWMQTQWPAQMSPELVALRSLLNRVRLLQVASTGRVAVATAALDMLEKPPTEPPPQTARAASLARRKASVKPKPKPKGKRS